jgi:hypothetical protein
MAPSSNGGLRVGWQWIAVAFVAIVAIWWIWNVNTAPPRPSNVVTITATQPPPQQQPPPAAAGVPPPLATAQPVSGLGAPPCPSVEVTERWLTICGAVTMDSQYVYLYKGYIYAPGNLSAFRLAGDTSSCVFSVMSNTLYVNCTSMIAVARAR